MTTTTNGHISLTAPRLPVAGQRNAAYKSALLLVARIDEDLTRGVRHYRTKAGQLLTTLDEVIRAVVANDLLMSDEEEAEVIWIRPEGLAT
jgi:hypothetical protein